MSEKTKNREKLSSAFDESDIIRRTHVGGQALIEGIMMRGRYNWALAVRKPNGAIYVEEHDLASGKDKNSWMYKPVIRGCTALVESLTLGYQALDIAANQAFAEEDERAEAEAELAAEGEAGAEPEAEAEAEAEAELAAEGEAEVEAEVEAASEAGAEPEVASEAIHSQDSVESATEAGDKKAEASMPKGIMTGAMIMGVILGVVIFVVVPAIVTNLLVGDYAEKTFVWNVIDGVLRVAIFIGYIFLIGRMSDIKRMFGYHGAEHRTIHCYERGKDLTVANAQSYPSLHIRCGTAFMLMTMLIAILVFTIVPVNLLIDGLGIQNAILRLLVVIFSRILLLPFIAGLSYELTVKWAGTHPDNPVVKVVLWPGLQLQRLTTNPPDDGMVECAIAAMTAVIKREELEAEKAALLRPEVELR